MKYEGEKFLLKLYRELYNEEKVKHSAKKGDNKYEAISKYLKRLSKTEKAFQTNQTGALQYLKNRYFNKYVIKEDEIPESYYKKRQQIAFEMGQGNQEYTKEEKHQEALSIINSQKQSLERWLDYLMKENTTYPMWARYWAFQGMIKLGSYDKQKHIYTKRSNKTTSPFIELNNEALTKTISTVVEYEKNKTINDEELKILIECGNFGKLYAYNMWKINEQQKQLVKNMNMNKNGIWKTYNKKDSNILKNDLDGKGTGWCVTVEETAKRYLSNSNIHIYYTKDKQGSFTIPRIAIREKNDKLKEIRGINKDQNIESEMLEPLEKKLEEYPDKKSYQKKVHDMEKLTKIYNKFKLSLICSLDLKYGTMSATTSDPSNLFSLHNKNQELSKEELEFLYEIKENISGFGWKKDPRIEQIKSQRNLIKDLTYLFSITKEQIGLKKEDLYNKDIYIYIGRIDITEEEIEKKFHVPKIIYGDMICQNLINAQGMENLEIIRGNACFENLKNSKGLDNLKIIGNGAYFNSLIDASSLKKLNLIEGDAIFSSLNKSNGLDSLETIRGEAFFSSLKDTTSLNSLKVIEGDAGFQQLETLDGMNNLESIKDNAIFYNLINLNGLNNLKAIGSEANFNKLINLKGLNNLRKIGNSAFFNSLQDAQNLKNLKMIGDNAYFDNEEALKQLTSLKKIEGNLYINNEKSENQILSKNKIKK